MYVSYAARSFENVYVCFIFRRQWTHYVEKAPTAKAHTLGLALRWSGSTYRVVNPHS